MKIFSIVMVIAFTTFVSSTESKNAFTSLSKHVKEHHVNPMLSGKDMYKLAKTNKEFYNKYYKLAVQTYFKDYDLNFEKDGSFYDFKKILSQFEKQNFNLVLMFPYNEFAKDKNNKLFPLEIDFLKRSFFQIKFYNKDNSVITAEMAFNHPSRKDGANLCYYKSRNSIFCQTKCDEDRSFIIRIWPQNQQYIVESTMDNKKYFLDFKYNKIEIFEYGTGGRILSKGIFNSLNFNWEL